MASGFIKPPWDDSKSEQEKREEQQQQKFQEWIDSNEGECPDCGQWTWNGQHVEGDCPEGADG